MNRNSCSKYMFFFVNSGMNTCYLQSLKALSLPSATFHFLSPSIQHHHHLPLSLLPLPYLRKAYWEQEGCECRLNHLAPICYRGWAPYWSRLLSCLHHFIAGVHTHTNMHLVLSHRALLNMHRSSTPKNMKIYLNFLHRAHHLFSFYIFLKRPKGQVWLTGHTQNINLSKSGRDIY